MASDAREKSTKANVVATEIPASKSIESTKAFGGGGVELAQDVHIYTGLVLWHRGRGSRSKSRSMTEVYGRKTMSAANLLGVGAANISRTYFRGHLSPLEVLQRHSLYGLLARRLHREEGEKWADELIRGSSSGLLNYATRHDVNKLFGLKWCEQCLEDDIKRDGFGSWYVLHQAPACWVCHKHSIPLLSKCLACNSSLDDGNSFALPGERCGKCGSSQFAGVDLICPEVHRLFANDLAAVSKGEVDYVSPSSWRLQMRDIAEVLSQKNEYPFQFLFKECRALGFQEYRSPSRISENLIKVPHNRTLDKYVYGGRVPLSIVEALILRRILNGSYRPHLHVAS